MVKRVKLLSPALLCLSLLAFTGCSMHSTDHSLKAESDGMGQEESLDNNSVGNTGRTSEGMFPVYFNFDTSTIRSDQADNLMTDSEFILKNRVHVRIEGNCDERGTNEYNLALGERRAQMAKKYLVNLGVPSDLLTTVSYGEERPFDMNHNEDAWKENRRDDFVIVK